ncbi:integrase catalytic domain-containing protein [Trichonephila clavipes]|nr:integrase catalytic domain-containing protein [Trichonephila clavipes]
MPVNCCRSDNSLDQELTSYINLKICENWYTPDKMGRELDLFMSSKVSSRNEINTGFRQNKLFKSGVDRKGLKGVTSVFLSDLSEKKCSYCCENHAIPFCTKFKQLSVHDRVEIVKKQRLCFLCLRVGCMASKCKAKPCKLCAKRHHVSLHFPKQNTDFQTSHNNSNAFHPSTESRLNAEEREFNPAFPSREVSEKDSNAVFAINKKKGTTSVFLSSVKCFVKDSYDEKWKIRGLLDVGSMTNLITKKIRRKIRITKRKLSRDEEKNFPLAAPVLRENFLYGRRSLRRCIFNAEAKALKNQLSGILKKGGMELHKWGSSHPNWLQTSSETMEFENQLKPRHWECPGSHKRIVFIFEIAVELKDSYTKEMCPFDNS